MAKHKAMKGKCAGGGKVPVKADGNPNVIKEAKAGRNIGVIGGVKGKTRLDRASGGGADMSPYSSAGASLRRKSGGCA